VEGLIAQFDALSARRAELARALCARNAQYERELETQEGHLARALLGA
jgi:hypothetical protein